MTLSTRWITTLFISASMLGACCCGPGPPLGAIHVIQIESPVGDTLSVGARVNLVATTEQVTSGSTWGSVEWSSSDSTIVSVDHHGTAWARSPGVATILARWDGPGATLDLTVATPHP